MKHLLKALLALPIIAISACHHNDIKPAPGVNTDIKLKNIRVVDYVGNDTTVIKGAATFTLLTTDSINTSKTDTIVMVDSFTLLNVTGYTQDFYFVTPAHAKSVNIDVAFAITGGSATTITMDDEQIIYNNSSILSTGSTSCETDDNLHFNLPTRTANY